MMPSRSGGGGGRTSSIKLLFPSDPSSASTRGGGKVVDFPVEEGEADMGVDLGAIGRVLGLDPPTVRLNGFLLGSRAPDHVAASVTWRSLLAFFSARGLPTGRDGDDHIVVRGKPSPTLSGTHRSLPGRDHLSMEEDGHFIKRKSRLENENPLKKRKLVQCNSSALEEDGDDSVNDSALCIKKKLRLDDDNNPLTKRKKTEANSGAMLFRSYSPRFIS